ncbi:adenylosuccinate lyase [Vulcanisaeta thermophila]|uniref:adenylosuccinate lyase n=1 Tax=Vulcanisaeta thermophila TaxID=867917 RepID=UPI00085300F4|nr:adenylosuccinate lyase [Vulcanisaeta thermophila]
MLSPLDDRYAGELGGFRELFSEAGFIMARARVELRYLEFLIDFLSSRGFVRPLGDGERARLRSLVITEGDVGRVRELEGVLGHDVKAIEYMLREKLRSVGLGEYSHLVHLGLTSEDVNNLALNLMVKEAVGNYLMPSALDLLNSLLDLALRYAGTPMLGRTHGQPATPTTFGKEMAYHAHRLCHWLAEITSVRLQGKVTGATGSMASFRVIDGDADWLNALRGFIEGLGLEPVLISTQILAPDPLTRLLTDIALMAMALVNLAQDLWIYNMLGYIHIRGRPVGSSTMPHKVNPVDLENAEGNLKLGSSILLEISRHLQVSRLQRDLSDSTIKRNIGLGMGHVLLAIKRLNQVVKSMEVDPEAMEKDLLNHWEVLSEAVQVRLRALGMEDAYEKTLTIFRGGRMTEKEYREALKALGINDPVLTELKPTTYTGYAKEITLQVINQCKKTLKPKTNNEYTSTEAAVV